MIALHADRRPVSARVTAQVTRCRWAVLVVWAFACAAAHLGGYGYGWHYFVTGADALASRQGLHLYAMHDQLQIGPLTLALVLPLAKVLPGRPAEAVAIVLMTLAGVLLMWIIERTCVTVRSERTDARVLLAGLLMLVVWAEVATHWAHPDDVLALLGVIGALWLYRRDRPLLAVVLLALAVDAKPWALLFAPMLLLAPRRVRWTSVGLFVIVVAAAWLPFYLASPTSLEAGLYKIPVSDASVLHLLGVRGGTPNWCRAAQLLVGALAVAVAVARRRWYAILFVGICARMLLDPATKNYYESGLLAASTLYDLAATASLLPVMSIVAAALLWLPSYVLVSMPTERAVLRLIFLIAAPCIALTAHRPLRR